MRCCEASSEPWRVGVLFSQSGVMAVIEETQLRATLLAIDEINGAGGINGRELVPVIYDPQSDPQNYALCAKRLIIDDDVTHIFGCYTSSSRKSVVPVVERMNGLLWYPTLYEGFEFSPNVIYTGATPNQNSLTLCSYLVETYGCRFYFVGSDYVYPRESNRIMRELLKKKRGCVVSGETYLNLRAKPHDFRPLMRQIKNAGADVIFSTVVGDSTVYLYQAFAEMGLDPRVTPIASLTTTESEVQAMGFDVAAGHVTAASYFQSVVSEQNEGFVRRYKARYGEGASTNMCAEAAYFQVHLFANTLSRTNSMDTDIVHQMVQGSDFEAPQGRIAVSSTNGHTDLWSRIGRVNRNGQFEIVRQSTVPVAADPFLIGCDHRNEALTP